MYRGTGEGEGADLATMAFSLLQQPLLSRSRQGQVLFVLGLGKRELRERGEQRAGEGKEEKARQHGGQARSKCQRGGQNQVNPGETGLWGS